MPIYGNIYHQYTPNVILAYIPYMDPMGYVLALNPCRIWNLTASGVTENLPTKISD